MRTWTGTHAPLSEGEGSVSALDVVVQLGRTRRFGGCGSTEWSVLHHSVLVSLLWLRAGYPKDQLHCALLHDAHEAYVGDIPSPVKAALRAGGNNALGHLERHVDARIFDALVNQPPSLANADTRKLVKACDLAALVIEARLFGAPGCRCEDDVPAEFLPEVNRIIDLAVPDLAELTGLVRR